MDPFTGQRWMVITPERIAWHMFTIGILGLLLLVLLVSVRGLGEPPAVDAGPPGRAAVPVEVQPVETRSGLSRVRLPGVVEPVARVEIGFRIDGQVARLHVREGQRVERGDPIATLLRDDLERDVRMAAAALTSARARARDAGAQLERQTALLARSSSSKRDHSDAELAVAVSRARVTEAELRLAAAEARLAKSELTAPFGGTIERLLIEEHETAAVGHPVVVLTDLSRLRVRASAPDGLVPRLVPGAPATVRTAAWPDRSFGAVVERIDVAVDPLTRAVPFEVAVTNAGGALRPEGAVEVEIELASRPRRPTLPVSAVLRDADAEPFCFVVEEQDGVAQALRRPLVLGGIDDDQVTVLAGLTPGEHVVVRGQHFLHAGDPLSVISALKE